MQDSGSSAGQDDLAVTLSGVARDLQSQPDADSVLEAVVRHALAVVPGAQEGSISLVR